MKLTRRILAIGALGVMMAACAAPVVRAQEAAPEAAPEPQDTTAGQIFRWLNFLIVAGALGYLIVKKAPPVFQARANVIAGAIQSATAAKTAAVSQLREAEAGLARLDQDSAKMRTQAERDFSAEAARLKASAAHEVEKIGHMADVEIDAAARLAQIELRTAAARVAVARAAAMVSEKMTPERRATIFQNFLDNLNSPKSGSPRGAN